MDWETTNRHFTEVDIVGPGSERVYECDICWSLVVESSRRLHLDHHAGRGEFNVSES